MRSIRSLAVATAAVFGISTLFPIVAALSSNAGPLPKIVGVADVIIAFALVAMTMVLYARAEKRVTKADEAAAYRDYRVLMHVIIVLLLIFLVIGDRIAWSIGLVGIAWRAWLLLYTLPAWYAALRTD